MLFFVIFAFLTLVAHPAFAATTIGTDIITGGSLTVTGTSTTGTLSIGSLGGFLKAASGNVFSTSSISLFSDVSGILQLLNGGTGMSTVTPNALLIGNPSGTAWTTISTSSLGITGGGGGSGTVTSLTASSPLTGGTITTSGSIGCQTASSSQAGCLASADWTTFNNKLSNLLGGLNAILGNSTTTNATTTSLAITGLSNTILAVNTNGTVIATTTSAGGVTAVNATSPVLSSGGATPTISLLAASTSQWNSAYASTTALNGVSPITYNGATGAISCPTCGSAGTSTNYWSFLGNNLFPATTTSYITADHYVATSSTATSTFAGSIVGTGTSNGEIDLSNSNGTATTTILAAATSTFVGGIVSPCFAISTNGPCITTGSSGGGGGINYLTNSGANTYLNTGTNLQALTLQATSTTGTSTIANSLTVGGSVAVSNTGVNVGYLTTGNTTNADFSRNAVYDGTNWNRATTTDYVVLNQLDGDNTTASGFQIYTAAPASNPISNFKLVFEAGVTGQVFAPNITSSGQSNALCYNSSTGEITDNAGVTTCLTSSERFKQNITALSTPSSLAEVMSIQPVQYTLKSDASNTPQVGLIAEQVEKIDPRLVDKDTKTGLDTGVNYQQYTAILTGAIQYQQQEIQILQAQVNQLMASSTK